MKGRMEARRHELLTDLADQAEHLLIEYGIDEEVAKQVANALADHVAKHWGGQQFTFPKNFWFELDKRDVDIWDQFNGRNHATLAKEFGLGERAIYKIIARVKDRQMKLAQPGFFDNMEDS